MNITIRKKKYNITQTEIMQASNEIDPNRIIKHYIEINGKEFPIKQVIAATLNISSLEFNSQQAYQILQDLGFEIRQKT